MWLSRGLILGAQLLSCVLASPLPADKSSLTDVIEFKGKCDVGQLNDEFKGIEWSHVIDFDQCTPAQSEKIIWATRRTMWLLEGPHKDMEYAYSAAWTQYFGDYKNWLAHGDDIKKVSSNIQCQYNLRSGTPRH